MKLPNQRPPEIAHKTPTRKANPTKKADMAPRGMWFEDRKGRDLPFLARWRAGKEKFSKGFASKEERRQFSKSWEKKRKQHGVDAVTVSPRDVLRWHEFDEMTHGADPVEVARFWLKFNKGAALTLSEAVKKYGGVRAAPMTGHMEKHLERLCAALGDRRLADVTADDLREWLDRLRLPRLGATPMSPVTRKQHVRSLRAFFSEAVAQHWLEFSAADAVALPADGDADEDDAVSVMTVEDGCKLFEANRGELCIGRLALEAFGGLRYTSAARLCKSDLLWDEEGIVFPGSKHKSGRRHFVNGWPGNLWAWLRHAHKGCWEITVRQYLDLKREAFERARVTNPGNVLRHSFASYHLALHRNQQLTAYLMTKTSFSSLNNDYRGRATAGDAEKWFGIMP
jgi:site-specific recombinase XerD